MNFDYQRYPATDQSDYPDSEKLLLTLCRPLGAGVKAPNVPSEVMRCQVLHLFKDATKAFAHFVLDWWSSMQLQATIQECALMMSDGANTVDVECVRWL